MDETPETGPPAAAGSFAPLTEDDKASIRILVVDDEETLRSSCVNVLKMQGFNVTSTGRGEDALEAVRTREWDIMLVDMYMTQVPGTTILKEALARRSDTIVVMMTGNPSVESNLEALQAGAWDYLPKPFSATHLDVLLGRAAHAVLEQRRMKAERESVVSGTAGDGVEIVGRSPSFRAALELARKVARSNASVFLTGESGSGKELIAQVIHQHSRRSGKPMVAVNCAALPEPLLESEMFGHEKGAFTGAVREKAGLFEAANGGTMFLDELTEMSQAIQAKLLRVIQDGRVRKVGSSRDNAVVDVRFIAATNRDPSAAVEEGVLREDLYYRLRVVPIQVPPLRDRREDIPPLARHFLRQYWDRDYPRARYPTLTDEAIEALQAYPWPGNVRELQNVIEHTVVLASPGDSIGPEAVPFMGAHAPGAANGRPITPPSYFEEEYQVARERVLAEFERGYVKALVNRAGGNMSKAARMAGVDRTTLYRLIEKHGLKRDTILRSQ